jgi:pyruvate kinase
MCSERKNVNLPGVVVDLPTLTDKDEDDLVHWGIPNDIDFIAASFVRKSSDLDYIRKVFDTSQRHKRGEKKAHLPRDKYPWGVTGYVVMGRRFCVEALGDAGLGLPGERGGKGNRKRGEKSDGGGARQRERGQRGRGLGWQSIH